MKTLCLLISLASASLAQTTDPVILEPERTLATATNASAKEIIYIEVKVTSGTPIPVTSYNSRDFFFGYGFGPAETINMVPELPENAKAQVTFVQFADGSTWGKVDCPKSAEDLRMREPKLKFYEGLLAAYAHGGEPALDAVLNAQIKAARRPLYAPVQIGDATSFETRVTQVLAGAAAGLLRIKEQAGTGWVLTRLRHKVRTAGTRSRSALQTVAPQ